ncbi:MAG: HEPN domain-containing protein [Limnochordia bacterium]|jgi:HEPN domain-containing protein
MVTGRSLALAYLEKAQKRLRVLEVLLEEQAYSDVVREAQEVVELALKAMLRLVGVEPPKQHDVGGLLVDHSSRFVEDVRQELPVLAATSKWLRKEREFAFYGDVDFIPTEEYSLADAQRADREARHVVHVALRCI